MLTRNHIIAGKSIFTISNSTGTRYTFKVTRSEADERFPPAWFVKLLTGPNNRRDYTYVGMLDPELGMVRLTKKSRYTDETLPVKVLRWALKVLWRNENLPDGYTITHEGYCCRCMRLLTVPTSVMSGIGPECAKHFACV